MDIQAAEIKLNMEIKQQTKQPINIAAIEKHYNGLFVGDFCIKTERDGWTDFPVAIFYQPNPQLELGHSHYFGMYVNPEGNLYITNGESAFSEPITGLITNDNTIIISRYRHDFCSSPDGKHFIDGGRDYVRVGGEKPVLVKLVINKQYLVVDPTSLPTQEPQKRTKLTPAR